jgi:glucuronate isomerase
VARLQLDPGRLFPPEPRVRDVASELHEGVAGLPIVSMHGHIDARILATNEAFADPASLLVTPDHYVTRLLHAQGVSLEDLGIVPRNRASSEATAHPEAVWRLFCRHWPALYGTASHVWLTHILVDLFGVDEQPSERNADELYRHVADQLSKPQMRPRALFHRFGVEVLATTDDPLDDLHWHRMLASDPGFQGVVIPTFRPDRLFEAGKTTWWQTVEDLGSLTGTSTGTFEGFVEALRRRRADFISAGARATDHAVGADGPPGDLESCDREGLFSTVRRDGESANILSELLLEAMAAMSCQDGLVMQLHIGVWRDHDQRAARRFGPDIGADFPVAVSCTKRLRSLLRHDDDPAFTLVAYSVDEASYGRDLAPMASYYRCLKLGAPWWFLDAPDAMARCWRAASESAGFSNFAGFVDDARGFLSIAARHDMARRVVCSELARLVAEHRLDMEAARQVALDYCYEAPRRVFGTTEEGRGRPPVGG